MHFRGRLCALALAALTAMSARAWAQAEPVSSPDSAGSGEGYTLGSDECGLGLGNVKRLTGLRLNFLDRDVERMRGVDLSLCGWPPDANPDAEFKGWTFGGLCLSSKSFSGITVSLAGVTTRESIEGITIGGAAIVFAKGEVSGVSAAAFGVYAERDVRGLSVAPFGIVGSDEKITGVNVALFGVLALEGITGVNVAGAIGSRGDVEGVNLGLGCRSNGLIRGITAAGVVRAERLVGVELAGIHVTQETLGVSIAPLWASDRDLTGLSVSLANVVHGKQRGVTAGAVNFARDLKGLQIGLLNIVWDNPPALRVLPFLNMPFRPNSASE